MKEKKLQVFVSSNFTDLIAERQAAVEAILSSGNIPAGMELFSAGDESQMTVIKRWIDESDVYLLILGGRYGSIEPQSGKSYTQLEYEYALEKNKALFAVVLSDKFIDEKLAKEGKSILELDNNKELKEFKSFVKSKMIVFCNDKKDIQLAIFKTLSEFAYSKELTGWIRGDNALNSNLLAEEIARLTKENDELRKANLNKNILFNGLSYNELKSLLKCEEAIIDEYIDTHDTLFEYLLYIGESLAQKIITTNRKTSSNLRKLKNFKIVNYDTIKREFYFSEDGHNFYLRMLIDEEN